MTSQNLPQTTLACNTQAKPAQDILLICANGPLVGHLTSLIIPAGKMGKVLEVHEWDRLLIGFRTPTVHLNQPAYNRVAILATQEVNQ